MTDAPIVTAEQMRAAELRSIAAGSSASALMHQAGQGAADWVHRMAAGRPVTIICGPGNNGGDGYVLAETLRRRGLSVQVVAPQAPTSPTARTAAEAYKGDIEPALSSAAPVVVDCLFGYGLNRPATGAYANLLEHIDRIPAIKIAIDLPSGVACDTGEMFGPSVQYDLTVALGAYKRAHFAMPARALMGRQRLVTLGLSYPETDFFASTPPQLYAPLPDAHKYSRGSLAVVGGSMPGASLLASEAAMRGGAGYVTLYADRVPDCVPPSLVVRTEPVASREIDGRTSALLIGPGLGRDEDARHSLSNALATGKPCVIDADAVYLLDETLLAGCDPSQLVITPHDGELRALCKTFGIKAGTKFEQVRELQRKIGVTVLAKGPDTYLAGEERALAFPRGSSWLSVAGTGDVLAGLVAARLATERDSMLACEEAMWLHSEASRLAGPAFCAGDLIDWVRPAFVALS